MLTSQPYAGAKMKSAKKYRKPGLDLVLHITLASVVVAFVLIATFPALQAMLF